MYWSIYPEGMGESSKDMPFDQNKTTTPKNINYETTKQKSFFHHSGGRLANIHLSLYGQDYCSRTILSITFSNTRNQFGLLYVSRGEIAQC